MTDNSTTYHLFSLFVHLVAGMSLFYIVFRLTASLTTAYVIALIFSLYPRHHETVYWFSAIVHTLTTAFILLSFVFYLNALKNQNRTQLYLSVFFFTAGLFSTEAGFVGLAAFITYELLWNYQALGTRMWQKLLNLSRRIFPYVIAILFYWTLVILGGNRLSNLVGGEKDTSFYHLSLGFSKISDYFGYLSYTIFPFVELRSITGVLPKIGLLTVSIILVVAGLVLGSRLVRFGLIWLCVTITPYALLVPYGNSDRYFYLPSVGFSIAVVGTFQMFSVLNLKKPILVVLIEAGGLLLLSAYVLAAIISLDDRAKEWNEAGQLVENMLAGFYQANPELESGTTLYFLGMPARYKQANFMATGIQQAVIDHYGHNHLKIYIGSNSELLSTIDKNTNQAGTTEKTLIFTYHNGQLLDRSSAYTNSEVRALLQKYTIKIT
jgi:hypothetical protein